MADRKENDERAQALEKEIMEKSQELHKLRREAESEPVEDYPLRGPGNEEVTLSGLFGDKSDLVLIHNMGSGCPYCTLWGDSFNGVLGHLQDRAAFAVVSPDDPAKQAQFAESRGWKFAMFSDPDQRFTKDMGFWGSYSAGGDEGPYPGFSTFRKTGEGKVERVASAFFGPGDTYLGLWHMFANLAEGVGGWQPKFKYD